MTGRLLTELGGPPTILALRPFDHAYWLDPVSSRGVRATRNSFCSGRNMTCCRGAENFAHCVAVSAELGRKPTARSGSRCAQSDGKKDTVDNESRCDESMKRSNMRNIRARLMIWIATRIVMMIDRSLRLPQELDEI
jgi:hypothetical protein